MLLCIQITAPTMQSTYEFDLNLNELNHWIEITQSSCIMG